MINKINNIGTLKEGRNAIYHKAPNVIFVPYLLASYGPKVFIMIRQSRFFEISLVASQKKFNAYRYFNTIYEKCCSASVSSHVYIVFVLLLCFCIDQFQFPKNSLLNENIVKSCISLKLFSLFKQSSSIISVFNLLYKYNFDFISQFRKFCPKFIKPMSQVYGPITIFLSCLQFEIQNVMVPFVFSTLC